MQALDPKPEKSRLQGLFLRLHSVLGAIKSGTHLIAPSKAGWVFFHLTDARQWVVQFRMQPPLPLMPIAAGRPSLTKLSTFFACRRIRSTTLASPEVSVTRTPLAVFSTFISMRLAFSKMARNKGSIWCIGL